MITIRQRDAEYRAGVKDGIITLFARPGRFWRATVVRSEESALHWLSDHSLKRSKAKQLLDAALRNAGPLAKANTFHHAGHVADTELGHGTSGDPATGFGFAP